MRRRTLLNATLTGMALTTAGTVEASRTATSGADADMARVLTERLSMQGMGLVAVKVQGEHLRWAGAGRRSAQLASSPDLNTPFELGSITKTFTALLLADMTLRGELGLDDAVEAVLPSALRLRDANGTAITFGDLATHRSGLPRLPSNLRRPDGEDPYDYTNKDLWDLQAERRQTEQLAIQVASQAMAELTGIYALQPQFKVTVTVRDGRLFAQATGQGEFELFAAEGRRWFAKVAALEVHFEGVEGPPKAFVLHQAGQRLRFIRE